MTGVVGYCIVFSHGIGLAIHVGIPLPQNSEFIKGERGGQKTRWNSFISISLSLHF